MNTLNTAKPRNLLVKCVAVCLSAGWAMGFAHGKSVVMPKNDADVSVGNGDVIVGGMAPLRTVAVTDGRVMLESGASGAALDDDLNSDNLFLWLDASKNVLKNESGGVVEWLDCRENLAEGETVASHSFTYFRARTHLSGTTYNAVPPTVVENASCGGLKMVDFGKYESGRWMYIANKTGVLQSAYARTIVAVVYFPDGCGQLLGAVSDLNAAGGTVYYQRALSSAAGGNISNSSDAESCLQYGEVRLDGERVNPITTPFKSTPQIFSKVGPYRCLRNDTETEPTFNVFFNDRNYSKKKNNIGSVERQGGGQIGEVLMFYNILTPAQRSRVESYLAAKWFGKPTLGTVAIAGGAGLETSAAATLANAQGDGCLIKKGSGTLTVSHGVGATASVDLQGGAFKVVGAPSAVPIVPAAGRKVTVFADTLTAGEALNGSRFEVKAGGLPVALTGEGLDDMRVVVSGGTVSVGPRVDNAVTLVPDEPEWKRYMETDYLSNGGFEKPVISTYSGTTMPTGWTKTSGYAYLVHGTSQPWWNVGTSYALKEGSQFLACQNNSSTSVGAVSQSVDIQVGGLYKLYFRVCCRQNNHNNVKPLVKVDGESVIYRVLCDGSTYDKRGVINDWLAYAAELPPLNKGNHTITLTIGNDGSSDRTALWDDVHLRLWEKGEFVKVPNPGFESGDNLTYNQSSGLWKSAPGGYIWTFAKDSETRTIGSESKTVTGDAGVTQHSTWWSYYAGEKDYALDDNRKAYLQKTGYVQTTVDAPRAGRVRFSMRLSNRANYSWDVSGNTGSARATGHYVMVFVDGVEVGRAYPRSEKQETCSAEFNISKGQHTLKIRNGLPDAFFTSDLSSVVDDIRIKYVDDAIVADPGMTSVATTLWTATPGVVVSEPDYEGRRIRTLNDNDSLSQTITVASNGWYRAVVAYAGPEIEGESSRGVYNGYRHYPVKGLVTIDGKESGRIQAESSVWEETGLKLVYLTAGTHALVIANASDVLVPQLRIRHFDIQPVAVSAMPSDSARTVFDVQDGAKLSLDFSGSWRVRGVKVGGRSLMGMVSAETHPDVFEGAGELEIVPGGLAIIIR